MKEVKKSTAVSRQVLQSVTCFLHCGDEYLFVHRTKKGNGPDLGKVNGIGGKREVTEDFVSCAIRETLEETGYSVKPEDCRLAAVMTLSGGYPEDWVMCFFTIRVASKTIPIGLENDEGTLLWMHKDTVLHSPYELVDDLRYCWEEIVAGQDVLFFSAQVDKAERITHYSKQVLSMTR